MIRLRREIERGLANPWLRPLLLIALCLLLALTLLHGLHDGASAATELGAFCVAIASMVGLLLILALGFAAPETITHVRSGRAPPRLAARAIAARLTLVAASASPPLRL